MPSVQTIVVLSSYTSGQNISIPGHSCHLENVFIKFKKLRSPLIIE